MGKADPVPAVSLGCSEQAVSLGSSGGWRYGWGPTAAAPGQWERAAWPQNHLCWVESRERVDSALQAKPGVTRNCLCWKRLENLYVWLLFGAYIRWKLPIIGSKRGQSASAPPLLAPTRGSIKLPTQTSEVGWPAAGTQTRCLTLSKAL